MINHLKINLFKSYGKRQLLFVTAMMTICFVSWTMFLMNWIVDYNIIYQYLAMLMIFISGIIWWRCVLIKFKGCKAIIAWGISALHILFMATITLGVNSVFSIYNEIDEIVKIQPTEKIIECRKNFSNMTDENFKKEMSIRGSCEFYAEFIILGIDKLENKPHLIYNEDDVIKSDSLDEKVNKINKKISRINNCLQLDKGHVLFNVVIVIFGVFATGGWIKLFPKTKKKE